MSQPRADPPPSSRAPAQRDGLEVVAVDCALLRVPLGRPIAGASARPGVTPKPFTTWDLISVTVRTKSGLTGWGLTYELRAGASRFWRLCTTISCPSSSAQTPGRASGSGIASTGRPTMPAAAGLTSTPCPRSTSPSGTSRPRRRASRWRSSWAPTGARCRSTKAIMAGSICRPRSSPASMPCRWSAAYAASRSSSACRTRGRTSVASPPCARRSGPSRR